MDPGDTGNAGNRAAHAAASAIISNSSHTLWPTIVPAQIRIGIEELKAQLKQGNKRIVLHQITLNHSPIPNRIPRGDQIFIIRVRAGAAVTEDIVEWWRYKQKEGSTR